MSVNNAVDPAADEIKMDELLRTIDELPSIPETLIHILKILDDPQSSAQELSEVVRLDAPLMAKILRLANSPYYTGGRNLADIQSCIAVLGFKTVRQVAICVSIATSLVSKCYETRCRIDYKELWRHSVIVGVLAKQLGIISGDADPEELFTAGLLHDLGKFVIILKSPEKYDQVMIIRQRERRPLMEVELDLLGYDHTMAGEAFGNAWRFPSLLIHCARWHHDRPRASLNSTREERAAAAIGLADYLAHRLEPAKSDLGFDHRFVDVQRFYTAVSVEAATIDGNESTFRRNIENAGAFMDLA